MSTSDFLTGDASGADHFIISSTKRGRRRGKNTQGYKSFATFGEANRAAMKRSTDEPGKEVSVYSRGKFIVAYRQGPEGRAMVVRAAGA